MKPFIALFLLASSYEADILKWRTAREAELKAEDGWLTVVGLHWLKEGRNVVELHGGAPPEEFELRQGAVTNRGKPLRPDSTDRVSAGGVTMQVIRRGDRIGIRVRDSKSAARREFPGLRWYPVREGYRVAARFHPHDSPKTIAIANVIGQTTPTPSPGYVTFTLNGQALRLDPVREGRRLFFIFKDRTSGNDTYGAGRFLYADPPNGGTVTLDFNQAINPPCAFTPYATCPLPPKQNHLPVRVEAGELAPPAY